MRHHKVILLRHLTDSTFVLRLERNGMPFQTGQFIVLKDPKSGEKREYSVYSGEQEDFLEVLVREVKGGKVSGRLKKLQPGSNLELEGPFGFFRFHPDMFPSGKFLFVATGTGISPFHSFIRTFPELDYRLVHGVRFAREAYDHADFDPGRTVLCCSTETPGLFHGRVTYYLGNQEVDPDTHCFLCGNSRMIGDVFDILVKKGISVSRIYSEVYF